MRMALPVFLALTFLLNCGSGTGRVVVVTTEDSLCDMERNAARESFDKGDFYLPQTRQYRNESYVEEAFFVLFGIKPRMPVVNDVVGLPTSCYDMMIDTLIVMKYGRDAFDRAQNYADNLKSTDPSRYGNECFYSPTYIPNNDSLSAQLSRTIHYPESAKRDSVSGVVYVRLKIDTGGTVADAFVAKGVRRDLDSTALDAAFKLGKFRTERRWGIKQASQVTIPIKFALK